MTLCNTICEVIGDSEITRSTDSVEALNIAKDINPDIVFLDIDMPGMDGMKLAKEIKESVNPKVNIIFTTGYSEYLEEAFTKLRASGYLMKPVTEKMLRNEIENLRYPPHLEILGSKAVRVRAFGTFEVYVNGTPVNFHYVKTKELLAYLIDRDGMCSISELEEGIFEEAEDRADHNLIVPLRENPFRQVGDESLSFFAFCISQTSCIFSCVLQSAALQCTF
ncbi:response regulator [Butyrivibrio sp. AE3009]|uniref:response regulator n=1 Tax=Butyrivibrio sp. AE3009 TaxID=1280666 RepID=UPI001FA72438|nr:response regulator [Butyrivibrio sp. AE3009]